MTKQYQEKLIQQAKDIKKALERHGVISSTPMDDAYMVREKINHLIGYILALEDTSVYTKEKK